jgi:thiol-disulfide isomerase/thioredoxin
MKLWFTVLALAVCGSAAAAPNDANALLGRAEVQATHAQKNVIVIFHASWCGWCHKLAQFLTSDDFQPIFSKNYVIVHIDVQENGSKVSEETPGGEDLSKKLGADTQGLPFFVILDAGGNPIMDSRNPKSLDAKGHPKNIGFPSEPGEVDYFMSILRKTGRRFTDADLTKVETYLRTKKSTAPK